MYVNIIFATYLPECVRDWKSRKDNVLSRFFFWYPSRFPSEARFELSHMHKYSYYDVQLTLEFLPDIRHLLVDSFLLQFPNSSPTDVRNKLVADDNYTVTFR